ncbi:MAG: peroxiredoxin [Pseudomonadota bacterium]
MTISVGDKIPSATVMMATANGPEQADAAAVLGAGTVAFFSVPGAFTPTCSAKHLPGFVEQADALKAKGVDKIVCMSVNDAFVMQAWGESAGAGDKVAMMADGNGDFARALGLTMDGTGFGMGERSQRFSAVVDGGVVKHLFVEEGGAFEVSSAEHMLGAL